jgi:hypothetical protein
MYRTTPLMTIFACSTMTVNLTIPSSLPISYLLAPLVVSSSVTPLTISSIVLLTSSPTAYSSLVTLFWTKMYFPLLVPPQPANLYSLLKSDPVPPPPQVPRLAPLSVPYVASTHLLAPLQAPRVAPLTSMARFVDLALAYHCSRRTTPSALADPAPSMSVACFADPALVYHVVSGPLPRLSTPHRPTPSLSCTTRSASTATPDTSTRW